jgi:hypothetical protein
MWSRTVPFAPAFLESLERALEDVGTPVRVAGDGMMAVAEESTLALPPGHVLTSFAFQPEVGSSRDPCAG